jgi:hypothetical protein
MFSTSSAELRSADITEQAIYGPRRCPKAARLAGVVELSPLGDARILPALPEEPKDL